ncbi:cytochrome P450 4g15-like [Nylanderia fulva]|uniref:cytochrome P450 4g15-like n=1 Tax=Nylanderia fulva TaxID=613905 RepID=UPI0010FB0351|nr:cytochrome P450 4g15-like [Nylanderia fulva]
MDAIPITTSYLPTIAYSLLAIVIAMLITLHYYIETSRAVRLSRKLPHPPRVPILGHALLFAGISPETVLPLALKYYETYGSVGSIHFGTRVIIYLADPKDVEIILGSSVHLDKSIEYRYFQPWLGDGLLITKGDKWRRHRKVIAPTFHMSILKTFVPLFYENSMNLVRRLRDEIGKEFDCHDYLSAVTVDILTETAMGVRRENRQNTGYDYAMAVMKMSDILHRRHYDFSLRSDIIFKFTKFAKMQENLLNIIHTLTDGVIKEKSKECEKKHIKDQQQKEVENSKSVENLNATKYENDQINNDIKYTKLHYVRDDLDNIDEIDVGEKKRLAFLDMMFDLKKNGGQMTDEEIREEVNTIMFEGHDTTAAGSSFALCALGCHQDIQARVHEELDAIFGDSDRQCTFQDTLEMKYLERVILETLRLFPPVPAIARQLNEDVKIITGNYILPKTATVLIPQFAVHRSEKYYPNPTVFNPDNFLLERMQQRHYYAFIPFSAGPRSCVGRKYAMLKLKVLLSTILRNYRVTSNIADKDFILQADIILKRHDGFKIKLEPRKSVFYT